jgi:outer membrane protein OmpA-like peptidoglycan-associated protein
VALALEQNHTSIERKTKIQAYSFLKPVDSRNNPIGWAHNRRVEIVLRGVTDSGYLKLKFRQLLEAMNAEK